MRLMFLYHSAFLLLLLSVCFYVVRVIVRFLLLFRVYASILAFFFFKQKTAYEMRISDWSSDVCSSDLDPRPADRAQSRWFLGRIARCGRRGGLLFLRHRALGNTADAGTLEARGRFHHRQYGRSRRQGLCREIFPARNQGGDGHTSQECAGGARHAHNQPDEDAARKRKEERRVRNKWVRTWRNRRWQNQ